MRKNYASIFSTTYIMIHSTSREAFKDKKKEHLLIMKSLSDS